MQVCSECGESFAKPGFCPRDGGRLAANDDDELLGQMLGSFRIARLLGAGGYGRVYLAVQPSIGGRVAIKVLAPDCATVPELVERFFAEARAVNLIRHESLVNVFDMGELPGGRPFIVMAYLDGSPLSTVISRRGALPLGSLAMLVAEALDGLEAAHTTGIVHRDFKPDNLFVTSSGRAKVLDFGIAKLRPGLAISAPSTYAGQLMGTPWYMAPEQARGDAVDARTDVYAAGAILFEGASGRLPFETNTVIKLLVQQIQEAPPRPRSLRFDLPLAYEQVILRALEKDPEQRFASAREMAEALRAAAVGLPPAAWAPLLGPGRSGAASPTPAAPRPAPPAAETAAAAAPQANEAPQLQPQGAPAPGRLAEFVSHGRARWISAVVVGLSLAALASYGLVRNDSTQRLATRGRPRAPAPPNAASQAVVVVGAAPRAKSARLTGPAAPAAPARAARPAAPPPAAPPPAAPPPAATAPAARPPAPPSSDGPLALATLSNQVDAAGITPVDYDPLRFMASSYVARALKHARRVIRDAEFAYLMAVGVHPDGHVDVTQSKSSAYYMFRSRTTRALTTKVATPPSYEPCLVRVAVTAELISLQRIRTASCEEPLQPPPRCSLAQVWQRARALGAPATGVASLTYANRAWGFALPGKDEIPPADSRRLQLTVKRASPEWIPFE